MVECEFKNLSKSFKENMVLIDTWWNVNTDQRIIFKGLDQF